MKHSFRWLVTSTLLIVACGSDLGQETTSGPPEAIPSVESKPSQGGTGGNSGSASKGVEEAADGGASGAPNDGDDTGADGAPNHGDDAGAEDSPDGGASGASEDAEEPKTLALGGCDLGAPFNPPVPAFTGTTIAEGVTFSQDGLSAFVSSKAASASYDLYVATRNSTSEPFGALVSMGTSINGSFDERAPSLSGDGLRLYMTKLNPNSGWSNDLAVSTRTSTTFAFNGLQFVTALSTTNFHDQDPFFLSNGNKLYYATESPTGTRDLFVATFKPSNGTYSGISPLSVNLPSPEDFRPVVSPDGLTLYFTSTRNGIGGDTEGDIWTAKRTASNPTYTGLTNLFGLDSSSSDYPVTVSPDGCTLYFASWRDTGNSANFRLYQATRGSSIPSSVTTTLKIVGTGSVTTAPYQCSSNCNFTGAPDTTVALQSSASALWTGSCAPHAGNPSADGVFVFVNGGVCTVTFQSGTPGGPHAGCTQPSDCQQGLECTLGTCRCPGDSGCSNRGDACGADGDCTTGLVCWREGARHFDKPGGTGVCAAPICRTDVVLGGCGDPTKTCGRCEGTPRPCTTNAQCISGEVCGTNNGAAFGLAPDGDFCWPPDCNTPATTPANCGTIDSACGICDCSANCAGRICGDSTDDGCGATCTGLCDDGAPGCKANLECQPGSVCGAGIGPRFGQPAGTNACWPADCAAQDPSLPNGGVDPARCGTTPACVPNCDPESTGSDGCGGFCGQCSAGEERLPDGSCTSNVSFIHRSGVDLPIPLEPLETDEVGATAGSFAVLDQGNSSYSIPILVPPGRLGIQPSLALQYLSTTADGMMGIGWSVAGLSTISRCRRFLDRDGENAPITLNTDDRFCLDGQGLVQIGDGTYGDDGVEYRTEVDTFAKIISHGSATNTDGSYKGPNWFEVRTKDGRILSFGRRGASKVTVRGGPLARVWGLNRIEDHAGNYLDIDYRDNDSIRDAGSAEENVSTAITDTGELLPATISYGGNRDRRRHSRYVRFAYESRPDPTHHFVAGVEGYSRQRLVGIDTFVGTELVKSYELHYTVPDGLEPSQLASVRECGISATGARRCLQPTTFEYFGEVPFGADERIPSVCSGCGFYPDPRTIVLDQNGDGRDDILTFPGHDDRDLSLVSNHAILSRPVPAFVTNGVPISSIETTLEAEPHPQLNIAFLRFGQESVLDLNRDGRDDLIEVEQRVAFLSQGSGFVRTPINLPEGLELRQTKFADFDGDGLKDLIACSGVNASLTLRFIRNSGTDFEFSTSLQPDPFQTHHLNTSCNDLVVMDVDGDGDDDLVLSRTTVDVPLQTGVSLRTDAGMRVLEITLTEGEINSPIGQWFSLGNTPSLPPSDYVMLDFNGDGLKDFLSFSAGIFRFWANTGRGFKVQQMSARLGSNATGLHSTFQYSFVMDRDGDGREDLVLPPAWYRFGGPGVVEIRGDLGLGPAFGDINSPARARTIPADIDGDGSQELVYSTRITPDADARVAIVKSAGSARTRLLHRITDGLGARVSVEYDGLYDPPVDVRHSLSPEQRQWVRTRVPSSAICETSTTRCFTRPGPLVSTSSTNQIWNSSSGEIASPASTILYQYFGPTMGLRGRGVLGFWQRAVENPLSRTLTTFHVDDFRLSGRPSMIETQPYAGMPSPLGSEQRFERSTFDWSIFPSGAGKPFPYLSNRTHTVYDGLSEAAVVQRTETVRGAPDAFGNELSRTVTRSSSLKIVETTTTSTTPIEADTSEWVIGLLDKVITSSARGDSRTRTIHYGYDVGRMIPTSIVRDGGPTGAFDPKQHSSTEFTPDAFGNINHTCVTDSSGEQRCTHVLERDGENIFPGRVEDAEGMVTELVFAAEDGQLLATFDANDIPNERGFDAFGRLQQVMNPTAEGTMTYAAETRTGVVFPGFFINGAMSVTSKLVGEGERKSVFDAFGRLVQTRSPGFDGSVVQQDREYDRLGRVVSSSSPHEPSSASEGYSTYQYDGVGRISKITGPDGNETEYFYTNVQAASSTYAADFADEEATLTLVKMPRGNISLAVRDVTGRVSKSLEAANIERSGPTETSFVHGPFGAVSAVIAPQGTTFYDVDDWGRNRLIIDPAFGTRSFVHNGFDEVVQERDARNQVHNLRYDRLGRLVEKLDSDGEVIARWDYDGSASAFEQGRLVASWRQDAAGSDHGTGVVNRYLGGDGLPSSIEYHVGATLTDRTGDETFVIEYTYSPDVRGRITEIAYPSNGGQFRVGYGYDAIENGGTWTGSGGIASVFPMDELGHEGTPFWTLHAADEGYRPSEEEFGNGVVTTRSYYDPAECYGQPGTSCAGRIKEITTTPGTGEAPSVFAHTWDSNGNLASLQRNNGSLLHYQYDSLDRLTREYVDGPPGGGTVRSYGYDTDGRGDLTSKTGAGAYTYEPRGAMGGRELRNVGDTTYWYDESGNQTERIGSLAQSGYQKLDYNDFDMPHHIQSGSGPTQVHTDLQYTAAGQRVVQIDSSVGGSTTRVMIGDIYDRVDQPSTAPTLHRYKVLAGSRQVAEVVRRSDQPGQDQTFYLHNDHLGSTTLVTNQDLSIREARSYEPFGAMTTTGAAPTGVLASFTGHDVDATLGLVNARGRLYDPKVGRFVTADPMTTNPGSSQGWNRYAYVENNPLAFADPSGFGSCPVINDVAECGCVGTPEECGGQGSGAAAAAEAKARAAAEAERAVAENNSQASADAAAAAAQGQAEAQRGFEAAQQGFSQGEATAAQGQPPPGYGQPTLAPPTPAGPNPTRQQDWEAAKAGAWNFAVDTYASVPNLLQHLFDPFGISRDIIDLSGDSLRADAPVDPRLREQYDFMQNGLLFLSVAGSPFTGGGGAGGTKLAAAATQSEVGTVFWTGGAVAENAARSFATRTGAKMLGMADVHPALARQASAELAQGARGIVDVFIARVPSPRTIWQGVEKPILQSNQVGIRTHLAVIQ